MKSKENVKNAKSSVILMPLLFTTISNSLDDNGDSYYVKTKHMEKVDYDEIKDQVMAEYKIPAPITENVLTSVFKVLEKNLVRGKKCDCKYFKAYLSARGTLKSKDERFDPQNNPNHKIHVNLSFSRAFSSEISQQVKSFKVSENLPKPPAIYFVRDAYSMEEDVIYKGANTIVQGIHFLLKEEDSIELTLEANSLVAAIVSDVKVESNEKIMFRTPLDLEPGEYTLRIKKRVGSDNFEFTYSKFISLK
ncbi:MAG: DNA-binding domain-containing protein [Hyphomicrobiales bacterium]